MTTMRADLEDAVGDSWSTIAAFAFAGYLREGRGFTLIQDTLPLPPPGQLRILSVLYTPVLQVPVPGRPPGLPADVLTAAYDPDAEIVLVLVHQDCRTAGGIVGGKSGIVGTGLSPSPRTAYTNSLASRN